MVLIKDKPIIWHLMNIFSLQGFNEFIISTGYKSEIIDKWVNGNKIVDANLNPMNISTLNTGLYTQTGGRISKVMRQLPNERIIATYGDGLANVSVDKLVSFHESHGKLATVTAVRPPARFGYMKIENEIVTHFGEKNQSDAGWINGGFFVLEPAVLNFINSPDEPFESGALTSLSKISQLMAYMHEGFWQPMDTLREKKELEKFASLTIPPWLQELD